jgi:GT2 family glycosyltransferase
MERESDNPTLPAVAAVVLTWNDTEMAAGCIRSLLANDYRQLKIVVVDNGSAEPCGERLREEFPSVDLVTLPENRGFTGGCNAGLERGLALGSDYLFLLNNDTVVAEKAVSNLVRALEERSDAGVATALLLGPGESKRVTFYTSTLEPDCAMHRHSIIEPDSPLYDDREWPTIETEFAPACALMFRANALREVGLFDDRLFLNWEDFDLCMRFQQASWPILVAGDAEVVHAHGATTGHVSPYITYYSVRNRLICLVRYGRPLGILRNSLLIARSFWWTMQGYGLRNWDGHRAFFKGVLHFLIGTRGKGSPPESKRDS